MLAAEDLGYVHADGTLALDRVTFAVDATEKVVVLGSNGCGKTTLLRLLDGLLEPTAGRVIYDGVEVNARTLRQRAFLRRFRGEVGLLFQNPDAMLFHATVREEIAFGPRELELDDVDTRVRQWAQRLGLAGQLDRSPFRLSSGEKQKVCLAALLVCEPRVLLLDEPTANLDPRSTGWLVDFLLDLPVAVLTTTHNLSLAAELGTRALVLDERHRLSFDGDIRAALDDPRILLEANLMHTHRHRHGDVEHAHPHAHDWG
jgi:cobalt/nickel transport system ATP-binding protein